MADEKPEPTSTDATQGPQGDLNPLLSQLKNLDPLGYAHDLAHEVKPDVIEGVIEENPDADMDTLNEEVQETLQAIEFGVGFQALHAAAQAKEAAFRAVGDTYSNMPVEEAQEILRAEGFECVLHEDYTPPFRQYLHEGEYHEPPARFYEVWFNPEGTLVELDTQDRMIWSTPPVFVGLEVSAMTLLYNWRPHPETFVYYSDEPGYDEDKGPSDAWREHVRAHHYGAFTSSGHFMTVSDEEWESGERLWVGDHTFVDGGFRHALHNLRANGRFEPRWLEAYHPPMFDHHGDHELVAERHYDEPAARQAVLDQQALELRRRYNSLPEAVKDCVGPYHTWETRHSLRTRAELEAAELAGEDYLGSDAPELPGLE